jgi:hypothetical protein
MDRFTTCFSSTMYVITLLSPILFFFSFHNRDLQNAIVSFKKDYEKYDWTHPKFRL